MLNSLLDDISSVVGYTATIKLRTWFAGQCVHVPVEARPDHVLVGILGLPALRALVREWGGTPLWIPSDGAECRYRRDREIALALAAGAPLAEVAARFGVTPRRVQQIGDEWEHARVLVEAAAAAPSVPPVSPRSRARRRPPLKLAEFLGTGGVSAEPPPSSV